MIMTAFASDDVRAALADRAEQGPGGRHRVASSLLNTASRVGGSIGLAILGTWRGARRRTTRVRVRRGGQAAAVAARPPPLTRPSGRGEDADSPTTALPTGFACYLVSGIALLALIITVATIRVTRQDLAGVNPMAAPA